MKREIRTQIAALLFGLSRWLYNLAVRVQPIEIVVVPGNVRYARRQARYQRERRR